MKKSIYLLAIIMTSALIVLNTPILAMKRLHTANSLQAEEYNDTTCQLTRLPHEILFMIFPHCITQDENQVTSLEKSIKTLMLLKSTCKIFNGLLNLKNIGHLCKGYTQDAKSKALHKVMLSIPPYIPRRTPIFILVYAGANTNVKAYRHSLLFSATLNNDTELITTLFEHQASPNAKTTQGPVFFHSRTTEIAQLFIAKGANVHAVSYGTNVLWSTLDSQYPSDLVELYLTHKVDAKQLNPYDNSCLLHALASDYYIRDADVFLKKAIILLNAIPDMINALDEDGQTPMNIAQNSLEESQKYGTPEVLKKLITLFKERGGLTARKLTQQVTLSK